ncbi:TPA: retropepsin-like aspartic protease family protein [Stenotrophomonas maltophilia]
MSSPPAQWKSRPKFNVVIALCLMSANAWSAASPVEGPSNEAVEEVIATPAEGIFALEAALPRIDDSTLMVLAQARLAAARQDAVQARRLVDRLLAGADSSPRQRALAWGIAAETSFADGDYVRAAQAAKEWQAALDYAGSDRADAEGASQTAAMAKQLAGSPAQLVVSYRPRPEVVRRDKVGLPRSTIAINNIMQEVVLDTGANLSVVSFSTARRLGLRLLDGGASVSSSSRTAVETRLAVADKINFAGLALRNVAFLVLDDEQLVMPIPGGYRIEAILGFPVLRELQRFRITATGRLEPSLSETPALDEGQGNLRLIGNDLFVLAKVGGKPAAMLLDSGGASSSMSAAFARRHAGILKGLEQRRERVAGAGGAAERRAVNLPGATVRVGCHETTLPQLAVELAGTTGASSSVLGQDVLSAFEWWSVDFKRMRLDFGPVRARANGEPVTGPAGSTDND